MKDTDGTLVHTTDKTMRTSATIVPGRFRTAIDVMSTPLIEVGALGASIGAATVGWELLSTSHMVGAVLAGGVLGIGGMISTVYAGCLAVDDQICRPSSLLRTDLAFLAGRRSIAGAASAMIVSEWNRSTITVRPWNQHNFRSEKRMMDILLPNGAEVSVLHRRDGRTLVTLDPKTKGYADFDPKRSLGMIGCSKILAAIERIQVERLSFLLGIPTLPSVMAVSRVLAEMLPSESKDEEVDKGSRSGLSYEYVEDLHTIERRSIKAAEINVTSIRPKHGKRHSEVFVEAPGIGLLSLPARAFSEVMARRRSNTLHEAFGSPVEEIVSVPVFLGNARATRLADLARQALREDPSLTDSSGSSIRLLIDEHMPRLLAVHRDGTSTASSSRIAEIDATLDRGLDVIARALGDAIDAMNDRKFDALRTEVRFLESRHPEQSAAALGLVA
jgi:hypothetical protein